MDNLLVLGDSRSPARVASRASSVSALRPIVGGFRVAAEWPVGTTTFRVPPQQVMRHQALPTDSLTLRGAVAAKSEPCRIPLVALEEPGPDD